MPIIPTYDSHEELDPDARGQPHASLSTAVAQAQEQGARQIQALGNTLETTLGKLGEQAQQRQDQASNFQAGLQDDARRQALQTTLEKQAQNMPANGTGFHDSFVEQADQLSNQYFSQMAPGRVRDQAIQKWEVERNQWSNKAAELQYKQEGQYSNYQINQFAQNAQAEVDKNPAAMDALIADGQQRIADAPGLTPFEKLTMSQGLSRQIRMEGLAAKYPNDPEGLKRELGTPLDAAPGVSTGGVGSDSAAVAKLDWSRMGVQMDAKRAVLVSHAVELGLPPQNAAAIVGHADVESNFKVDAHNPAQENSHGLFQWNDAVGRWAGLQKWAAQNGRAPTDPMAQLDYAKVEASRMPGPNGQSVWQAVQNAPTLQSASKIWMDYFEQPKVRDYENRSGAGMRALSAYQSGGHVDTGVHVSAKYPDLTQQDVHQLVTRATAGQQKQQAETNRQNRQNQFDTTNAINDDLASVAATGKGNDAITMDKVETVLGPDKAKEWADNHARALATYQATAGMDAMSNDDLQAHVASLAPTEKDAGAGYVNKAMVYGEAQKRALSILKERADDPASVSDRAAEVAQAKAAVNPQDAASYRPVIAARMARQASLGIPEGERIPITKSEALGLIAPVNNAPSGMDGPAMKQMIDRTEAMVGPQYAPRALQYVLNVGKVDNDTAKMLSALMIKAQKGQAVTQTDVERLDGVTAGVALRNSPFMAGDSGRRGIGSDAPFAPPQPAEDSAAPDDGQKRIAPPDTAIIALIRNPSKAADFDSMFGRGSSKRVLDSWGKMTAGRTGG